MVKKVALCRVSDTEPLLSLVTMLEYAGYECVLPDRGLRDYLRSIGCTNVDEFEDMRDRWGAEMPPDRLKRVGIVEGLTCCDLYVDVDAFHNGPLIWGTGYHRLEKRTLCYFINGGPPRNTVDKGDGITPTCPVMTTNQWYGTNTMQIQVSDMNGGYYWQHGSTLNPTWKDKSYVFYPSFERYDRVLPRTPDFSGPPVCFCHNVMGWGYGDVIDTHAMRSSCRFLGGGNSPDGLVKHEDVFKWLAKTPCVVYLKGGGAVDYAVLEAMAMGVPIILPKRYAVDTHLEKLLRWSIQVPDQSLIGDVEAHIKFLKTNQAANFAIGDHGKEAVKELCWQPERDGPGFVDWLGRMGF